MRFPFDEINMCDPEHVEWVKATRDPELWHVAAGALLTYLGDPHLFLLWLFDQDEVDRATAGYIFLGRYGERYLAGDPILGGEGVSGSALLDVFNAICRRSEDRGFASDRIGLEPGLEQVRQKCLDLMQKGAVAADIIFPRRLLAFPFPTAIGRKYFVEDGALLDYDPNSF